MTTPRFARIASLLAAAAGCAGQSAYPGAPPRDQTVRQVELFNANGEPAGTLRLLRTPDGAALRLSVGGLTPGPHGIHFHAAGECKPPDFASAGSHFNPGGKKHGLNNPEGPHAGDLPNLMIGALGSADTTITIATALIESGPGSLLQPGGASVVVHAKQDDQQTDPTGNSGERLACGVIRGT